MKQAILYITTNLINGKKYIGQTTSNRKNYYGSGRLIMAAIKKYGKKNFKREDLYIDEWEFIDLLEHEMIEKYNANESPLYYNLKEGGHTGSHSEESRSIMSEKASQRVAKESTKQLMSEIMHGENNPFYGKTHTPESIDKIKEARAKQVMTEESNKKRSAKMTGVKKPLVTCPHCDKTGGNSLMTRYHFDNCKRKR